MLLAKLQRKAVQIMGNEDILKQHGDDSEEIWKNADNQTTLRTNIGKDGTALDLWERPFVRHSTPMRPTSHHPSPPQKALP